MLEKILKGVKENKRFLLASSIYIASSAFDFFATNYLLSTGKGTEINPLLNQCISSFGTVQGLLIPKAIMAVSSLSAYRAVDLMLKGKKTRLKAEIIPYSGSFIYVSAGLIGLAGYYLL